MWILTDAGRRCALHDETFALDGACPGCVADPPKIDAAIDEQADVELWADEQECRDAGRRLIKKGLTLADKSKPVYAAAKLIAEGVKLMRLSFEMREVRRGREHDAMLIRKAREMRGLH